ncbi:Antibiotic biosynthesis monooxygenase [Quadrisphaera granulorum]|uniref:Antibiotic biosynthesis monooxygenase n=1 Tax=Quadrisphaera granulorum TaxID=317664 RepID=A0A316A1H3_9ACTN|nr:antibiotic biosynthesis monooxygenase [Quadrisphaera granulorum]PWJ51786.1 antibiotic biosynthesis monooxygenase [Quadrisphaera granulorum]SZE97733.1 Antibiotic biosynthesis monooxygenase [Quadrisphaera granulorum]
MPSIVEGGGYATFVNVFHTDPAHQARVIEILVAISDDVAASSPGFRSASTHASVDGRRVFNYLQWDSPEALAAMQQSAAFRALSRRFAGVLGGFEEYSCEVVHVRERTVEE